MKLDPTYLSYITKDELRVLTAIEMGMRNHEFVPIHLIQKISHLKRSNSFNVLRGLQKNKLVYFEQKKFQGYKLTYMGYDFLALYVFMKRGSVKRVIGKHGVGKESDIYKVEHPSGEIMILKLARLGRTSFMTVKNKRDYLQHRKNFNWLYLSRLASVKEYLHLQQLYESGFSTPRPVDSNRHGIVMSLIDGHSLHQVRVIVSKDLLKNMYDQCIKMVYQLAENGLIHSDYNEYNLMIDDSNKVTMIDFPQMVSTCHYNANFYFTRDLQAILTYFDTKHNYNDPETEASLKQLDEIQICKNLDVQIKASGYLLKEVRKIEDLDFLDTFQRQYVEKNENIQHDDLSNEDDEEFNSEFDSDNEEYSDNDQNIDDYDKSDLNEIVSDNNTNSSQNDSSFVESDTEYEKQKELKKQKKLLPKKIKEKAPKIKQEETIKKALKKKEQVNFKTNKNNMKMKTKIPEFF